MKYMNVLINKYGVNKTFTVVLTAITCACIGAIAASNIIPNDPVNPDTINNEKENIYEKLEPTQEI